jgi:hypothetical protein
VDIAEYVIAYREQRITLPLGFDRHMAAALPAMLYCLQLPRTRFDTTRVHIKGTKESQRLHLPHRMFLVPTPCPEDLVSIFNSGQPTIIFTPDDLFDYATVLARRIDRALDVVRVSDLSPVLLQKHWRQLHNLLKVDRSVYPGPSRLIIDYDKAGALLPTLFSIRALRPDWEAVAPDAASSQDSLTEHSLDTQVRLSAIARLESLRTPRDEAERIYPEVLLEEQARLRCPVAVAIAGASPHTATRVLLKTLAKHRLLRDSDGQTERAVLELLVAHRSLSRLGLGFVGEDARDAVFQLLRSLEITCGTNTPRPRPVWRDLRRLGAVLRESFSEIQTVAMSHASSLTAFCEAPVGLMVLPGDTSPLCCRIPISYRPIIPLTRALQFELTTVPTLHLRGRLNVLVAECIPMTDIVGRLSRTAWTLATDMLSSAPSARVRIVDVNSLPELLRHVREERYDVLVLSAHGHVAGGRAGLVIGQDFVVDQDLGQLPMIVCLSACQVAPRGQGTVNITDLMMRHGALAVIGTLVPVDVRRNATLMVRFFVYLAEALKGEAAETTLDAVWHFVQMSNAVNDVLAGNPQLSRWAHGGPFEQTVLKEFMDVRSVGRIRPGHVYADTEVVLSEIARDRGIGAKFDAWMRNPGYLPESLFYVVVGWPERIYLNDRRWAELEDARRAP